MSECLEYIIGIIAELVLVGITVWIFNKDWGIRMTDEERLMECVMCEKLDGCNAEADDGEGHCTQFAMTKCEWLERNKDVILRDFNKGVK